MSTRELEAQLNDWCQSYVTAFSAYDAPGIEAHWTFPALILGMGRSITFKSAEHFTKNTSMLLGFYKRQGVAAAQRELLSCMEMNDAAASMRVRDGMVNDAGEQIVTWEAAYVLQKIDGAWRSVCAAADGESAAWEARGTPLGS